MARLRRILQLFCGSGLTRAQAANRARRLVLLVGLAVLAVAVFWLSSPPHPLAVSAEQVRRVEVRFEPWGRDRAQSPGASSDDREAIDLLVEVVRSGRETRDHKCGSRGSIRFHRSLGFPVELRFLPGHHPDLYEFRSGAKVYVVSRSEFVAAMRRVGVEVPLECH